MITKVKSVKDTGRTFESHGKTFHVHQYEFDNNEVGQANHASKLPFNIGDEVEIEEKKNDPKYGKTFSVKKPNDFKKGGYKKPTLSFVDVIRMVRTNAIHAVDVVNANYREKRLDGNALAVIEKFTLGNISGDIERKSEEDSLLTSRLASVNNAAIASGYESVKSAADLIKLAESRYKYVTR